MNECSEDDFMTERLKSAVPGLEPKLMEPYRLCEVGFLNEKALECEKTFSSRSLQAVEKFVEWNGSVLPETFKYPEGYFTLSSDFLFSLCVRVPPGKHEYEVAIYDHASKDLTILGCVQGHRGRPTTYNSFYFPSPFIRQIYGCFTADHSFAVFLAHSESLVTLSVFDIATATSLLTKSCPRNGFHKHSIIDIDINPREIAQGRYKVALLNDQANTAGMEVRLWDPITVDDRDLQLDNFRKLKVGDYEVGSCIKFSPDSRFLCLLTNILCVLTSACTLIDPVLLEPLYVMHYRLDEFYHHMRFAIFPTFSTCGSIFALYQSMFLGGCTPHFKLFKIPSKWVPSLKELCRYSILSSVVNDSKLSKLPLSNDLKEYVTSARRKQDAEHTKKKSCILM